MKARELFNKGIPEGETKPCHICGDSVLIGCIRPCELCGNITCEGCMTEQENWKGNTFRCCLNCAKEIIADE